MRKTNVAVRFLIIEVKKPSELARRSQRFNGGNIHNSCTGWLISFEMRLLSKKLIGQNTNLCNSPLSSFFLEIYLSNNRKFKLAAHSFVLVRQYGCHYVMRTHFLWELEIWLQERLRDHFLFDFSFNSTSSSVTWSWPRSSWSWHIFFEKSRCWKNELCNLSCFCILPYNAFL